MNCFECRQALKRLPAHIDAGPWAEHLEDCGPCRDYWSDLLLQRELAELQTPEPPPGFLPIAIKNATAGGGREPLPPRALSRLPALAASVLVALIGVFAWQSLPSSAPGPSVLSFAPQATSPRREEVQVVIYSSEARNSAEVTIELAENLELEGYAGERNLRWNTALSQGANVLSLPLLVRSSGGEVLVRSSFGGKEHEVRVEVNGEDRRRAG